MGSRRLKNSTYFSHFRYSVIFYAEITKNREIKCVLCVANIIGLRRGLNMAGLFNTCGGLPSRKGAENSSYHSSYTSSQSGYH